MHISDFIPCIDFFFYSYITNNGISWEAREIFILLLGYFSNIANNTFHTSVHPSNEKFLQCCSFLQFRINPHPADNFPTH